MLPLIVNGNSYSYPQPGDKANTGWGSQATNWASAVTDALTALGLGGTLTPAPNAVVDISSTTKGILIPRLTTTQRNAITSPATSLLIFNTTLGVFQYYTGSAWITVGAKIPDNVQFDGTLLVNGNINTNGSITAVGSATAATGNFTDATDATNADTAPLKTLGGMAVKKKLFVGTDLGVGGNTTVDGVIYADDDTTANTPVISFTGDTNTGIGRSAADTLDFITNGNSRFRIEDTGQIKAVYESTLGTDYNITLHNGYFCRAWVNFDGTSSNLTGTYSRTGTTITVSITSHGLTTGQSVYLDFTTGTGTDGIYIVTVVNANSYTVTDTVSGSTTGNVTQFRYIRASGNVSSITDNGTGDYTVNFTTAMPDANYATIVSSKRDSTVAGSACIRGTIYSTSQVQVGTTNDAASFVDSEIVNVGIFR